MNLGALEQSVLAALGGVLGEGVRLREGPPQVDGGTGLRAELFVHAANFQDAQDAGVARRPWRLGSASGWREERPAHVDLHLHALCPEHRQAQQLAGLVLPAVLEHLSRLRSLRLSDPADSLRRFDFGNWQAFVLSQHSQGAGEDGAEVRLRLRLQGLLRVRLAAKDGLAVHDPYAQPLQLRIEADPAGTDLQREVVSVQIDTGQLMLDGWQLRDAAGHRYEFKAGTLLLAGRPLMLWTRRGKDDETNCFWGRRKPVWNNTGDLALLLDPEGRERARASWQPPMPTPRGKHR